MQNVHAPLAPKNAISLQNDNNLINFKWAFTDRHRCSALIIWNGQWWNQHVGNLWFSPPTHTGFIPAALIRLLFDVTPWLASLRIVGPYHFSCNMGQHVLPFLISSLLKKRDGTEGEVLKGRISMCRQSSVKLLQTRAAGVTFQRALCRADSLCLPVSSEP